MVGRESLGSLQAGHWSEAQAQYPGAEATAATCFPVSAHGPYHFQGSVGTSSPLLCTQVASGWDQPVGRGQRKVSGLLLWALGMTAPVALQAWGAGLMTLVSGSFYSPRGPSPNLASFPPQTLPSAGPPMRGLAACPASGHDCFLHGPAWCWRAVMPREA